MENHLFSAVLIALIVTGCSSKLTNTISGEHGADPHNIPVVDKWAKANQDSALSQIHSSVPDKSIISTNSEKDSHYKFEKKPNFNKNFKGDSVLGLVKEVKDVEKLASEELTKTVVLQDRLDGLMRSYTFVFGDKGIEIYHLTKTYNPDDEKLNITYEPSYELISDYKSQFSGKQNVVILNNKNRESSYVGQNGFGAIAGVTFNKSSLQGVVLTNIKINTKDFFSISIDVSPKEYRVLKNDLALYIEVELTKLEANKKIILESWSYTDPTISSPYKGETLFEGLPVILKEIGVYRKSTGEILGWKKS